MEGQKFHTRVEKTCVNGDLVYSDNKVDPVSYTHLHIGGVPISLSTSGGALIAGLVFGWWRSKRPTLSLIHI